MTDPFELRTPDVPPAVVWIIATLEEHGFETWTVGGGVRDAVLGRPSADWDLATLARPHQVQKLFSRTVPVGVDHGTVGVLRDGHMFEVTTFRRDIKPLGRRAVVEFSDSLDEDLARRDFTLNALAWHPIRHEIRDPFSGAKDLQNNVLRAVGVAGDRFREDYLRILRGLRFAGNMDLEVEPETWLAMTEAVGGLETLSRERVREELMKVLSATSRASATLALYDAVGALAVVMPELDSTRATPAEWVHTLTTVDGLRVGDPVLRVAAILTPVARNESVSAVLGLLHRLRFSNAETERIAGCVAPPWALPVEEGQSVGDRHAVELRRWAASAKPAHRASRLRLAMARARATQLIEGRGASPTIDAVRRVRLEMRSGHPLGLGELEVDGRDLIRLGMQPGPTMGDTLDELLQQVLIDPSLNTRERLLEYAREIIARVSND